jgi:hypothetical protein
LATVIVKSNVSQATDVTIADLGVIIPQTGGTETFIEVDEIRALQDSIDLRDYLTDDAHGAGSSTLILNDGGGDITQAEALNWLDTISLPTPGAPADVTKAAADAGNANKFAREDHKHDIATATPVSIGASNTEGTSTSLARADHTHNHANQGGGNLHATATETVQGFIELATQAEVNGGTDTQRAVTPATLAGTTLPPTTHAASHLPAGSDPLLAAEVTTLYVGKHGDDSHPGTHISEALLTWGAALTIAAGLAPSSTNRVVIRCHDGGIYAESLSVPSWVSVFAPRVRIEGNITVSDDVDVVVHQVAPTSGVAVLKSGSRASRFRANTIDVTAAASMVGVINSVGSTLICDVKTILVGDSGFAVGDLSTAGGHTHVECEDIYLNGANGTGVARLGSGTTEVQCSHILESGAGVGTGTAVNVFSGTVDLVVTRLDTTTAYIVGAAGTLNMLVASLTGTATVTGTANVTEAAHQGDTSNPHAVTVVQTGGDAAGTPRPPTGAASGQLGGTYPGPDVRGLRETGGPTLLTLGSIADGTLLIRVGSTIVGVPLEDLGMPLVNVSDTSVAEGNHSITGFEDKVLIKRIRVETTAVSWGLTLYSSDDYISDPVAVFNGRNGDWERDLDLPYEDGDGSNELHYNFTDSLGSATHNIEVWGVKLS